MKIAVRTSRILVPLCAVIGVVSAAAGMLFAGEWKELKSDHFIVYFSNDENFAKELLSTSEGYYRDIASAIGYARYSGFWTWDNRCKIYIYPDHATFIAQTGQPQWSQGMADYTQRSISSFAWSSGFLESLLPHEMAHLIFRDFVGFKGEVPLWLDEGVAQWAEKPKRNLASAAARQYYQEARFFILEDLMKLDISALRDNQTIQVRALQAQGGDKEKESILSLRGDSLVSSFYLQSASLVVFLIEKLGSDRFAHFCRQLRDGKDMQEALRFAFTPKIRSVSDLQKAWVRYLDGE
ncbi:MAG: hypothetical protein KKC84_04630 [Candidatus Omnitrophica bacterium]|nr:hypothetical protein [Candidatus Omnitrophota bacterium]